MRPLMVVVEGLDGSGKSTAAASLAGRLDAELLSSPPRELAMARETFEARVNGAALPRRLFYLAMNAVVASDAARLRAGGRSTVVDRYLLSTLAYSDAMEEHLDLAPYAGFLVRPDVTLLLTAPLEVRRHRMTTRGELRREDARTLDPAFEDRLVAAYRRWGASGLAGRFLEVDASGRPDQVVQAMLDAVEEVAHA